MMKLHHRIISHLSALLMISSTAPHALTYTGYYHAVCIICYYRKIQPAKQHKSAFLSGAQTDDVIYTTYSL